MNDPRNNLNDTNAMLSAYVDGELDFADRRRVEELIRSDSSYAQEVEELRLLKGWLQDLPTPAPRRSFTLDPATAPRPRRLLFPTLRWATAVAAVLLMLTVSVDVLENIGSGFGGGAPAALTTSAGGAASSASGGAAANEQGARSEGSGAASGASEAQELQPLAQDSLPSASDASAAGGAASASDSTAASASLAALAPPLASAAASASAPASSFASFSASPAPSDTSAATTQASASAASEALSTGSGTSASVGADPSLADTDPTGPDTVIAAAEAEQQSTPTNTLRIAQVVLLIATAVLGAGAWFARRRNI
jgi:hypothetical protein